MNELSSPESFTRATNVPKTEYRRVRNENLLKIIDRLNVFEKMPEGDLVEFFMEDSLQAIKVCAALKRHSALIDRFQDCHNRGNRVYVVFKSLKGETIENARAKTV